MYEPPPEVAEGFTAEDYASDPVFPYPDNIVPYELFWCVRNQWKVGPQGPFGLDYFRVYRKMDRMELDADDYDQLERDIEVMEDAALKAMRPPPPAA